MTLFQKFLIGVRFVGLKTVLRTLLYSLYRDRVDKRFQSEPQIDPPAPIHPEKIELVTPFHTGAVFNFNQGIRLEVTFLSASTVRITWQPGPLPIEFAVENELTVALQVDSRQEGDSWWISAGELSVIVSDSGRISYAKNDQVFREDEPPRYLFPGWKHAAELPADANIFGLGERAGYQLRPGNYQFWNEDVGGSYGLGADPLYLTIPIYYCRQDQGSYLAFYENHHRGMISLDSKAAVEFKGGALRMYVMSAELPHALQEYSRLTGRAPLPPRWAFGYHQCRWGYKSEKEIRALVEGFRWRQLPLEVIHLDIDYMDGYRVFSVDENRFPDLAALAADLEADGIKLVTIIDPGVKIDPKDAVYQAGLTLDAFLKLPDGRAVRGLVWPGWVNFPDFSKSIIRIWWGELYRKFIDAGVDGFWHDMNEPAAMAAFGESTLPMSTQHFLEGREGSHLEGHNLYGAQMDQAGFEGISRLAPEKRPWLLTRSGWAGVQRYAWKWTGDVESTWPALKMTIGTILGTGISGIPYSGSDIGGFSGSPDAELFTRWFQMSTFMALFRNHAATGAPLREPWQFGEKTLAICRKFMEVRQGLLPYLYSLAWEANQSGAPLVRPLAWVDGNDARLWEVSDSFMLGDALLVAPVVNHRAILRQVILPKGRWYSFWNDDVFEGGGDLILEAVIDTIPVLIREGVILPKLENGQRVLHYYVQTQAAGEVTSTLYTDEGDGYGDGRVDTFTSRTIENVVTLKWKREGDFPLEHKTKVVVHGAKVQLAWVDGQELSWEGESMDLDAFTNLRLELE
jgi:alpha-glucosidase